MDTTEYQPYSTEEIEAMRAADAEEEWIGQATIRLNQAQQLLDDISKVIETIEPQRREHAADLLDTAIETLTRITKRFPSPAAAAATPSEDPPF